MKRGYVIPDTYQRNGVKVLLRHNGQIFWNRVGTVHLAEHRVGQKVVGQKIDRVDWNGFQDDFPHFPEKYDWKFTNFVAAESGDDDAETNSTVSLT